MLVIESSENVLAIKQVHDPARAVPVGLIEIYPGKK